MQETWKIAISPSIQYKDAEHLVQELLLENQKEMGIFLSYYYKKEGAVVENVELNRPIIFLNENRGYLTVDFELIHFNACLNIHEQNKDKMKIQFELDRDSNKLILIGPYWPEREMDEI
jgi:hypothetical protein